MSAWSNAPSSNHSIRWAPGPADDAAITPACSAPPVPLGLNNGNVYRRGSRPPFRPQAVIEALRQLIHHPRVASAELVSIVGAPRFINGCTVSGDFASLVAGRATVLRLEARVSVSDDQASVLIENFPPNANPDKVAQALASGPGRAPGP